MLSFRSHLRSTGVAARLAVGILAILLLLANLGSAGLFLHLARTQERLLEDSLETTAAIIAGALPEDTLFPLAIAYDPVSRTTDLLLVASYQDTLSGDALADAITSASARAESFDISLLSPDGWIIIDRRGYRLEPMNRVDFSADAELIRRAASGQPASSSRRPSPLGKRIYQPLVARGATGEETVVGILRLQSRPGLQGPYERIARRVLFTAIGTTALILVAWWLLSSLIKRATVAERIAQQSDRLRALGTVTAGIAHEIRNPLGILALNAEELRALLPRLGDNPVRPDMEQVADDLRAETRRLRDLTDQFLDFTRGESGAKSLHPADLARSAGDTARLFQKGLPPNIALDIEVPAEATPVPLGENRIRQILLNLLRNAQDALGNRPSSTIRVRVQLDGARAIAEVTDNGPGMDAATLARVFDPFFTTRDTGTGLGLSLSRSLAEAVGGRLELESKPGTGTTARLTLPLQGVAGAG
jgi:signal transduction histidine kinase